MNTRTLTIVTCVTALCLQPIAARGYRPFVTEDAGVADPRAIELETSWDTIRWSGQDWEHALLFVPIVGLGWRTELSLEIPVLFTDYDDDSAHSGIGDVSVVGKLNFLRERPVLPALTLKGVVKTSTGDADRGLGSGDTNFSLVGAASKGLGEFILHGMFGYTFVGDDEDSDLRDILLYGAAVDYALTERFHLASEVTGTRHPERGNGTHPVTLLVGLTHAAHERVVWDGGIRFGLNHPAPDWSLATGVSISLF